MTDATFNRYDPWYVKVALSVCHFSRGVPGDTAQCPKLHRATGSCSKAAHPVAEGDVNVRTI